MAEAENRDSAEYANDRFKYQTTMKLDDVGRDVSPSAREESGNSRKFAVYVTNCSRGKFIQESPLSVSQLTRRLAATEQLVISKHRRGSAIVEEDPRCEVAEGRLNRFIDSRGRILHNSRVRRIFESHLVNQAGSTWENIRAGRS